MRIIVGAKLQNLQDLRHHPSIMVQVRSPHDGVDFFPVSRTSRLVLFDQVLQGFWADYFVDYISGGDKRPIMLAVCGLELLTPVDKMCAYCE